ncbi:MAG TPA: DUF6448 family protein [Gaiellaceae bacterium]|nr:DUF6448 family protein [Gaiellaceae bacterium]
MPPHCDSLDGPVVAAARQALDAGEPEPVLPFVPATGETEVRAAFEQARAVRAQSPQARELADRWFYENVVRIHRAGEGAPYTGLKPAGLDVGPVIPLAERAIESGSADELTELLAGLVAEEVERRLARVLDLQREADGDLATRRRYVEAMLGLQVWAHHLYAAARSDPHEHGHG